MNRNKRDLAKTFPRQFFSPDPKVNTLKKKKNVFERHLFKNLKKKPIGKIYTVKAI